MKRSLPVHRPNETKRACHQVNVRVEPDLYRALESIAEHERRSVDQTALRLMEEGLRERTGRPVIEEETPANGIASLAAAGSAFDWLAAEPDLYDEESGEPV